MVKVAFVIVSHSDSVSVSCDPPALSMDSSAALRATNSQWANLPNSLAEKIDAVCFVHPTAVLISRLKFLNMTDMVIVISPPEAHFIAECSVMKRRRNLLFESKNMLQ